MGSGSSKKEKQTKSVKTKLVAARIISSTKVSDEADCESANQKKGETSSRRKELLEFVKSRKDETDNAVQAIEADKQANKQQENTTDSEKDIYSWPETADVENLCPLCRHATMYEVDGFACRVCGRAFHVACLRGSGHYTDTELQYVERAKTNIGWSCHQCDNITSLLTPEEMTDVSKEFDSFDMNKDDDVSLSEYLDFQKRQHEMLFGRPMTKSEEELEARQFRVLDVDGNGSISYMEFLKHRATLKLAARSTQELVRFLTAQERLKARHMFDIFDENKDGAISMSEARMAYRSWYTHLENLKKQQRQRKNSTHLNKAQLESPELNHHVSQNADMIMQYDEDKNLEVDWREFLRGQSLYLISSRPNKASLS